MAKTRWKFIPSTPKTGAFKTAIRRRRQPHGATTSESAYTERMQPGVVYTTFHHPESNANLITTDNSDWATNCPEYKVTAVQVALGNQATQVAAE